MWGICEWTTVGYSVIARKWVFHGWFLLERKSYKRITNELYSKNRLVNGCMCQSAFFLDINGQSVNAMLRTITDLPYTTLDKSEEDNADWIQTES